MCTIKSIAQSLITDHFKIQTFPSSEWSSKLFLAALTSSVSTFTLSSPLKTSSTHICVQVSGEWQNIAAPWYFASTPPPLSGIPTCWPNITDPFSGERREETIFASCSWRSSGKRWKKDDTCMADILPWTGISDDRVFKGGITVPPTSAVDKKGPLGEIKAGSKTSPGTKATGKVSGVDLNSWWPYSQNPVEYKYVLEMDRYLCNTFLNIRSNDILHRPTVKDSLSYLSSNL